MRAQREQTRKKVVEMGRGKEGGAKGSEGGVGEDRWAKHPTVVSSAPAHRKELASVN